MSRVPAIRFGPVLATALVGLALYLAGALWLEHFVAWGVFTGLFRDNAVLGVVAVGMTFVILSGGIDLSVGAVAGCASIAVAVLVERAGWSPPAAIGAVLITGVLFGATMGWLIHAFDLPPFIVTLAGLFFARGTAFVISRSAISLRHPFFMEADAAPARLAAAVGGPESVVETLARHAPTTSVVFLATLVLGVLVLRFTRFGRNVYAVGGNSHSAMLMGLPVGRTRIGVYAISGFCGALGGVLIATYRFAGDPTAGVLLELDAIAAVVIGGTLLTGGVGGLAGTLLGVLILGLIQTAVIFASVNSWWTRIAVGGLLLAFILLQRVLQRTFHAASAAPE